MLAMPKWFAAILGAVLMVNTIGGAAWLSHVEGRVTRNTVDIKQSVDTVTRIETKLDQLTSTLRQHDERP